MTDKEILEYMKERFDQVSRSINKMERGINKMEKGIGKRFDGIDRDVKALTVYKSETEGSLSTIKWLIGMGFSVVGVVFYIVTLYLKHK